MTDVERQTARALGIYQKHLDVTSRLVMDGDADAFCDHIRLPYVYFTATGESVNETRDELILDITKINDWLRTNGATDYFRIARTARFIDADTIAGVHTTFALRGAISVIEPYANRMILRRIDGQWRATRSQHELSAPLFADRHVKPVPNIFVTKQKGAAPEDSTEAQTAFSLYQGFLDTLSAVVNTPDFAAWAGLYTYPHQIHYDATDHVAQTPEDVQIFFDHQVAQVQDFGGACLIRSARHAEFLTENRIFGYHDTIIAKDGKTVFGPVKSRMMLTFEDSKWKCSSVTNSLSQETPSASAFTLSNRLPTIREIQERMRK